MKAEETIGTACEHRTQPEMGGRLKAYAVKYFTEGPGWVHDQQHKFLMGRIKTYGEDSTRIAAGLQAHKQCGRCANAERLAAKRKFTDEELEAALRQTHGAIRTAARSLGVNEKTIRHHLWPDEKAKNDEQHRRRGGSKPGEQGKGDRWTAEQDALILSGVACDLELAKLIGRTRAAVQTRRVHLQDELAANVEVPPRPTTDEEFAKLPVLDLNDLT